MQIQLSDIPRLLGPGNSTQDIILSIFIYIVFFMTLISMLLQSDKTLLPNIVLAGSLVLCVLAKLILASGQPLTRTEFGTYVVNAGMWIFPALVAGMTRVSRSRGPAIIAAVVGAVYMFLFWLLFQRF